MLVVLYAVIREKGKGVPCMGCFSFSRAFGSYTVVSVVFGLCTKKPIKPIKPKKPKNLKTFFKNLGFFPALSWGVKPPLLILPSETNCSFPLPLEILHTEHWVTHFTC